MDKKPKKNSRICLEYPDHLKEFINTIVIKEDSDDPRVRMKRVKEARKKKTDPADDQNLAKTSTGKLTEEEIVALWKSLKVDFPNGKLSRPETKDIVGKLFPRFDAEIIMKNIFEVFDSRNTGKIVPNELLWVFSMSTEGNVEDKLKWMFKLYDKDGNGEIDVEEMEDIFTKLCKIVERTESDAYRKAIRESEAAKKRLAVKIEREREKAMQKARDDLYNERRNKVVMFSEKKRRMDDFHKQIKTAALDTKNKKRKSVSVPDLNGEEAEKVGILKIVASQLHDPLRDYKKFDHIKRAREIFNALDSNGDGTVTEEEFISGCLSDETFVKVLDELSMDFIWSSHK